MAKSKGKVRRQESDGGSQQTGTWFETVKPIAMPVFIAIATTVGSILAYVLTPARDVINAVFWEERAELYIVSSNRTAREGDVVALELFVQPESPVPISAGLLEVTFSPGTLRPGTETTPRLTTVTSRIDASTKLFSQPLEFIAVSRGIGRITASLKTKTRTFDQSMEVEILPSSKQVYPTRRSFTGTWNIDLGGIHGQMTLEDIARTVTGSYSLSDGNNGLIEGSRDGETFRVTLYRGVAPSRFFVEAKFDSSPLVDLQIIGRATLKVPTGNPDVPWKDENNAVFHAVAMAR